MFLPLQVEVASVGEDVTLAIGSWRARFQFETAVLFASWLDECSRAAKAWTGNGERRLRGIGTLHDASAKDWINQGQPNDPNRVLPVSRDILKKHQIAVRSDGAMVVVNAAKTQITIPHEGAQRIAHWMRVRAKESQIRAGDLTRHWSKITSEHVKQNGPGVTRG